MSYLNHLQTLDRWFEASRTSVVPCATGCSACCHGPFDISPADAKLVAEAVAALSSEIRAAVERRSDAQCVMMKAPLPEWAHPWDVETIAEDRLDAACDALAAAPCPALDAAGSCLIHEARPATCRMTGMGMVLPSGDLLENVCPIQADFPAYAAMAPSLFDLLAFESESEWWDAIARTAGYPSSTIAGAVALQAARG